MKPGDSMTISPALTNDGNVPMYMFIRVEMPVYGAAGLYEIESSWDLIESGTNDDGVWVEVYRYGELDPDQTTSALADHMTMVDMPNADFTRLADLNVSMEGFGCATDGVSLDGAWGRIKLEYGDLN